MEPEPSTSTLSSDSPLPGLLLLICIHGFKGNDDTFEEFPKRISYNLSHTLYPKCKVEPCVYPAYKTSGDLAEAVAKFTEWLTQLVAEREMLLAEERDVKGKGKEKERAKVVLLGHSMGGLVAADTVLNLRKGYLEANLPLWPSIIGCIAYDTPYLGLNPGTFSNTADHYIGQASQLNDLVSSVTGYSLASLWGGTAAATATAAASAKSKEKGREMSKDVPASTTGASSWMNMKTMGALGGTALAAAAAGAAWSQRAAISSLGVASKDFVTSHLEFVGALWKADELRSRLHSLCNCTTESGSKVGFHCFYTKIDPRQKGGDTRTFIILPSKDSQTKSTLKHFTGNKNSNAANEVDAHVSMFSQANDGGHDLAIKTVSMITDWMS